MTELAVRQDAIATPVPGSTGANLIREAAAVMVDAHALAKAVCNTKMIPKHFQGNPDECAAAMLYGASLGLDPMQSVRQIYVVHGQAALYARAMDALVKGAGHETWTVSTSDESVTVAGCRRGSQHVEESTWDIARAKKAGYTNNEKYRTDPQAMLYSKALSEVCRKIAPDVLNGVYAVEELEMEPWDGTTRTPRQVVASQQTGAARMGAMLGTAPAADPKDIAGIPPVTDGVALDTASPLARAMFAALGDAGITDRDDRLDYVSSAVGREVSSSSEMTEADARAVLANLEADAKVRAADEQTGPDQ
jgi:hypothetical protein